MHEKIKRLVKSLDDDTRRLARPGLTLYLVGAEDSPYIKHIRRKAEELGVTTEMSTRGGSRPTVVDLESVTGGKSSFFVPDRYDIDQVCHEGLSCVAAAAFEIIDAYEHPHSNVAIIGRGHSTQGLSEILKTYDYTPLGPCHRKTQSVERVTRASDIIVNGADEPVSCYMLGRLIVDISGTIATTAQRITDTCSGAALEPPKELLKRGARG